MASRKRKSSIDAAKAKRPKEDTDENVCPTSVSITEVEYLNEEIFAKALVLIARNRFVTILGPNGSGRTTLSLSVAKTLKPARKSVVLYVNDQLDSNNLFGSYKTTGIPGDFTWEETLFAKSVQEPDSLIILKGFESATNDLVVSLLRLTEDGVHPLPGGQKISMHENARIVAIVSQYKDFTLSKIIAEYPFSIVTSEYDIEEIVRLVTSRLNLTAENVRKYYEIFKNIQSLISTLPSNERRLSIRDFFVACKRLFDEELSPTKAFMALYEAWVLHLSREDRRLEAANLIANSFSLSVSDINFICNVRVVEIEQKSQDVTIGRAKLDVHTTNEPDQIVTTCALTRDYRNLLERIAVCVQSNEPVLLNGETGIGKTKIVQQLARYVNAELLVINMSLDSDAADLIGGYKPASIHVIVRQQMGKFFNLLDNTPKHEQLKTGLIELYKANKHSEVLSNIVQICVRAMKKKNLATASKAWGTVYAQSQRVLDFMSNSNGGTPFAYVSGIISRAIKDGNWLLIDEVNMASVECLNSIASLLSENENLAKSNGFRLFACMNPATDSGKRLLPTFIRSKFTEFFVLETREKAQLCEIINHYTPNIQSKDQLAQFYLDLCEKLPNKFSLRNLCRSLLLSKDDIFADKQYSMHVALQLGFSSGSEDHLHEVQMFLQKHVGNKPILSSKLSTKKGFALVEGVQFPCGPHKLSDDENFLRTDSIKINLQRIACATASGRFPVLLEGETSAGKTSILTYLAALTGHKLHRINNHEHTDVQEYLGSYVADESNQLVFRDGVLLQAMQQGDWVILDELNLAPTEVLEALNRLLDDNREVYVPEKDLVIKAHPQFRLFATQNPIGRYAGRKRLSRAFLNRFVVLNIKQPSNNELVEIVVKRCKVHKSAADIMINVMEKLKELRSGMNLFSSTDAFMTLRDLFRWGNRYAKCENHADWHQLVADQGYLLLAGRCRRSDDRLKIQEVIATATKRKINIEKIFELESSYFPAIVRDKFNQHNIDQINKHMILTFPARQMIVQCAQAFKANEPVLFVGETGCGKTSVAYMLAENGLESINCHERIDTSDFLGKIRPTNDGMFKWEDGVVVRAMKSGKLLLLDEISLAQDSVLERLNPLLEIDRKLLLTDSGAQTELIEAQAGFQFVATMNPGGDHGKKELSKALRNRFTEVWCSFDHNDGDIFAIIQRRIQLSSDKSLDETNINLLAKFFTQYFGYFNQRFAQSFKTSFSVRDVIVVSDMVCNLLISSQLSVFDAVYNTISATIFDALPLLPSRGFKVDCAKIVEECQTYFLTLFNELRFTPLPIKDDAFAFDCSVNLIDTGVQVGKFFIPNGPVNKHWPNSYCFNAPTAALNVMRVARGLASDKPIMLEGSPGAGKSSLIKAIAELTGNQLIRINLSEQTEVSDLFGADVPTTLANGKISFVWQDGPVLKAIKNGAWLLLDEMNLASQSILEAMNSCFDFRNEIYIAELNRRFQFDRLNSCRFFACQNSAKDGGGRKALPKSFLNRFTKIYVESMTETDMHAIVQQCLTHSNNEKTADFYIRLHKLSNQLISLSGGNSFTGAPYEFNLRDLLRLIDSLKNVSLDFAFDLVYIQRLHNEEDKLKLRRKVFTAAFERDCLLPLPMIRPVDGEFIDFGGSIRLQRQNSGSKELLPFANAAKMLASQTSVLQKLAACVNCDFLSLLIGPAYSGKRAIVEFLAQLANFPLRVMRMTLETDAQDLMGSYEQIFCGKRLLTCASELKQFLQEYATKMNDTILTAKLEAMVQLHNPNDIRALASDILKHVFDEEVRKQAEILANNIASETLHFEWIDSDFVNAYTNGEWLLIEDVNVCSSAVLDRLNNCLEKDGELVITEKADGTFKTVTRHPNFRVFFAMCPDRGSLSPAMRNRAVEIFLDNTQMFVNSVVDKIRLIGGTEFETALALRSNDETIQTLNSFESSSLLKICSFTLESRQSLFELSDNLVGSSSTQNILNLFKQNTSLTGTSIINYLRVFYENAWPFFFQRNDPALTFFYSRLASGIQGDKAMLFATMDKSTNTDLINACNQLIEQSAHSDCTILGVEPIELEMTENQTGDFRHYLLSHLWLCLWWTLQRNNSHPSSCFSSVEKLLLESQTNEPTVEVMAVCLHERICNALAVAKDHFVTLGQSDEKRLFEVVTELFKFNALLRNEWDSAVGDVALMRIVRQLETLGLKELLNTNEVDKSLSAVVKFSVLENRSADWKQLCPLPDNLIAVFNSNADLRDAENSLVEFAKINVSTMLNPTESNEFIVDVVNQFALFSQFITQLNLKNFNFDANILDFPAKALSAFHYLDTSLRQQHAEMYLLNARFTFGESSVPFSSIHQFGAVNAPVLKFWRHMNYRQTLHEVPIGDLIHFTSKLRSLKRSVWELSNLNSKVYDVFRSRIATVDDRINDFEAKHQSMTDKAMLFGLERMKSHAPLNAIDPLLCVFADRELTKAAISVLNGHYEVLNNYAKAIFGDGVENPAFNRPALPDHNKFILFVRERYIEAMRLSEEFSRLGENCRPHNSQYQRLGNLICAFINNAEQFSVNFSCDNLPIFIDKLNRHRSKLLSDFFHYPDVILPYLFGTCELEYQLNKRQADELTQRQIAHCASMNVNLDSLTAFFSDHQFLSTLTSGVQACLKTESPLPEHVQYQLMLSTLNRLGSNQGALKSLSEPVVDWLTTRWLLWFEAHSTKRKELYEYKKTSRLNRELEQGLDLAEDEMPDMELIEIKQLLPDFSKLNFNEESNAHIEQEQKSTTLTDTELLNTLHAFIECDKNIDSFYSKIPTYSDSNYLPAIAYCSLFENLAPIGNETENCFAVHHVIELNELAQNLTIKDNDHVLDVYHYSDSSEVLNCIEEISRLKAKIYVMKEEFPEDTNLNELLRCIDSFLKTPCDSPQMQFASLLEKLLEKSTLWERNVPRQFSLSNELSPLNERLLTWRKMEVHCWEKILDTVGTRLANNSLLTSWPLVETFTRQSIEENAEQYEKKCLAVLLQWLNDSSLFDLSSRLKACRLLGVLLKFTNVRTHLISKIESVCRYYAQFLPRLESRVKEERSEAEEKLQNLVKVAKYTDLNIWSIKDSAQRVHNQLTQIIHRFKIGSNKAAQAIFTEDFPPIPDIDFKQLADKQSNPLHNHANIINQLSGHLKNLTSLEKIEDLTQLAFDIKTLLNEDVNYSELEQQLKEQGTTDDEQIHEAKKKAYGTALFRRQKLFADLKKVSSEYGLNYRKGLQMGTEELNELAMTKTDEAVDVNIKQLIPLSICARNIALRLLSELNLHNKPHLKSQISTETFAVMRGLTEFGLGTIVNTNNRLSALTCLKSSMSSIQTYIQRLDSNVEAYNYRLLCKHILAAFTEFAGVKYELNVIRRYLDARPAKTEDAVFNFEDSQINIQAADETCSKLGKLVKVIERKLLKWVQKDGNNWVWSKKSIDEVFEFSTGELIEFSNLCATFKTLLPTCTTPFLNCQQKFVEHFNQIIIGAKLDSAQPNVDFDLDSVKLKIQSVYHAVEQNSNEDAKPLECLRKMLTSVKMASLIEIEEQLKSHVLNLNTSSANTKELLQSVAAFYDVLDLLTQSLIGFLERFTVFYLNLCSIVHHIVTKGMVNPIPVIDKTAEGEGKMVEGTGAGDGSGEKDVSDQIEETGQLEDLQGQENQENSEDPKDTEAPIDMDDDFAANLENIDGDENQDENEDDNDESQENQVDWDVGEVGNEEEEKQLDPKLFENQDDVQPTDQEEQGANEETGEMAAQAEDSKILDEVDQKDQDEEEASGEESGDEMENVDDINLDDQMDQDGIDEGQENQENNEEPKDTEAPIDMDDENQEKQEDLDVGEVGNEEKEKQLDPKLSGNQDDVQPNDQEDDATAGEQGEKQQETLIGDKQGLGIEEKTDDSEKSAVSNVRNQADEALADASNTELVDRDEKDDEQQLEEGDRLAHVLEENKRASDLQLAQASSIEQASNTKDRFHRPEERKEKGEQIKFVPAERKINEHHLQGPIVKSSTNFDFISNNTDYHEPMEIVTLEENDELEAQWSLISESVEVEAAELAEQLRILVAPTIATKLQGDYRNGKRLNMRKIIPYIASNFVKDRIWLQRKKLDKRDYRVVLAIDSSASMEDNQLKEITCQTVCLIERAFQLLQIGQVSVVSFGQNVKILRDFDAHDGKHLLGALKFDEKKTNVSGLLNAMRTHFEAAGGTDKLLIVLGDGRFSDTNEQLKSNIANLLESGIMVIYVILDSAKNSVFKIKVFQGGKLVDYMAQFAMPYWSVIQNASQVPFAISEVVRQFIELNNC
ncbi:Midasin [Aphelenchoides bicaudatus]|nr:Midasin [Aphelenchoides bicaudatus]